MAGVRALGCRVVGDHAPQGEVAGLVDECTPVAAALGAVNCLRWVGDRLVGDNTDGEGFVASLRRGAGLDPAGLRCLVVGAGGAARAVVLALAEAGAAEVVVVNRTAERAADGGGPGPGTRAGGATRRRRRHGPGGQGHPGRHGRVRGAPAGGRRRRSARARWRSTSSTTRPSLPGWPMPAPAAPRWWAASGCWSTRRRPSFVRGRELSRRSRRCGRQPGRRWAPTAGPLERTPKGGLWPVPGSSDREARHRSPVAQGRDTAGNQLAHPLAGRISPPPTDRRRCAGPLRLRMMPARDRECLEQRRQCGRLGPAGEAGPSSHRTPGRSGGSE